MSNTQPTKIRPIRVDLQLDLYGLNPYEFRIYAHIARRGECYSNLKTMAAICNMSVRQAQYALERLKEMNLISKQKRLGKTDIYQITEQDYWNKPDRSKELKNGLEYYNRAIVRRELGEQAQALKDFKKSIELFEKELLEPGKDTTRKRKDFDDAKKELEKEFNKVPD